LERHPEAYLLVVGDGPQRPVLEVLASELGVWERTIFAGFRKDVSALLRRFTVMAMPSLYEGLPVVPMEACMAGVPVVAAAVYGVPEVVMDGVSGLLVPPGEPAPLADALASLLEDAPRRAQMAEAGRKLVEERFSLEAMVEATVSYYRDLLSAKQLPARAAPREAQRAGH
jgi:glycosyltransferase involved in cell wall biosynthesis